MISCYTSTHTKSTVQYSTVPCMKSKALCTSPTVDIWFRRSLRNGSWLTVEESPTIARCLRALVTATLLLRCSDKNPTSPTSHYVTRYSQSIHHVLYLFYLSTVRYRISITFTTSVKFSSVEHIYQII